MSSAPNVGDHYEILAKIGEGGMGVVYKARDKRLDRPVALKLLPADKAADQERIRRFTQEARAASALNHPNIVTIYEIASEDSMRFIAMEYVPGKPLDELIPRKGMRLNEALKIAIQIADAVSVAAAAEIVHRDLKPANVMVTDSGVVKVLDFGLAKLSEPSIDEESPTLLNDEDRPRTREGSVLGTCSYMSPEQAEGKPLDPRSDIFSFGAVVYEMITGRRAFSGKTTASILAAVLRQDPEPLSRIAPHVPPELERIVQRCLRKDPNRRFQHMTDVKVELEEVREESESGTPLVSVPVRSRRKLSIISAVAGLALVGMAVGIWWSHQETSAPPPSQPVPLTSYAGEQIMPDFSPDGNQIVFAWNGEHRENFHLYVKPIASTNYRQLTSGDAEDRYPKWSPDGQWIAFQRRDTTGSEQTILMSSIGGNERKLHEGTCDGLWWSNDAKEVICGAGETGLIVISIESGDGRHLTSPPKGQSDSFPSLSPDGHNLLFVHSSREFDNDLFLLEVNDDLSAHGKLRRITSEHAIEPDFAGLSWSPDGREAIWAMSTTMLFDETLYRVPIFRKGALQPLPFVGRRLGFPAVARHQNRVAYTRWSFDIDFWQADGHTLARHPASSTELEWAPQFSPDGKRVAFESDRSGPQEIWVTNRDGTEAMPLTHFGHWCGSPRWSPDGRWIVFDAYNAGSGGWDVWIVESGGGKPRRLTHGPGTSQVPSFSHDGKWVYFSSTRTGRGEVFRAPFDGGPTEQLTYNGGAVPQESADGKMVYFIDPAHASAALYEAPVAGGPEHSLGVSVAGRAFLVVPDGIYFITIAGKNPQAREIRFYDFATRKSRLIQSLGELNNAAGFTVSPDRKAFLFPVLQEHGRNLMLIENFR